MAATMGGFDMGFGSLGATPASVFGSIAMDGDEYVRCNRCGYGGCDVRVSVCGCTLHTRCLQLNSNGALSHCPQCEKPTKGLVLFPMSFREIDEAHRSASALPASKGRGRKRKGNDLEDKGSYVSDRRTGRWTVEEMSYCDKLMAKFASGELPVAESTKLNEFLGAMLKSKQSRLTKKMKNAKLSSKSYQRTAGCLNSMEAREFSELEDSFFQSVTDLQERAEIKFHMQKEWREQLSRVCATIGQPLDADSWLSSVEEMDRRASQAKDAARMAKRKLMMGVALRTDSQNPDQGVFIERSEAEVRAARNSNEPMSEKDMEDELLSMLAEDKPVQSSIEINGKSSQLHSAPFLTKGIAYLERHNIPFEHIDLWVPSFVPGPNSEADSGTSCRLCFAGSATVQKRVTEDGKSTVDLTAEEQFNFFAFGDYSQKFSFDVGCGLPGRVYESGRPTWEQSVHNAPHTHFERCGGALQWGINTVVGIPIASPNVGRIVVVLYSSVDRVKDEDTVIRLSEEFTRLMPSPKWKLVVDVGEAEDSIAPTGASETAVSSSNVHVHGDDSADADFELAAAVSNTLGSAQAHDSVQASSSEGRDHRADEIVSMLGEFMPSDPSSPMAPYVQGFMSLRLLLLRPSLSNEEQDILKILMESYSSYSMGGRPRGDTALMLVRDYLFLTNQQPLQVAPQHSVHQGENHYHQPPLLNLGQNMMGSSMGNSQPSDGLSLFGLPSASLSLQNSPALHPIPAPGINDTMSIVSN